MAYSRRDLSGASERRGGCLSYLIGYSQAGHGVAVDPARDRVNDYVTLARKKGLRITDILETHVHAAASLCGATLRELPEGPP